MQHGARSVYDGIVDVTSKLIQSWVLLSELVKIHVLFFHFSSQNMLFLLQVEKEQQVQKVLQVLQEHQGFQELK